MAALGRQQLRLCGLKRLISIARTAKRAPRQDVGRERTMPSLSPHREGQARVPARSGLASTSLLADGRCCNPKFHRFLVVPLLQKFLYSAEVSTNDEGGTDNFLNNNPTTSQEAYNAHITKLCKDGELSSIPKLLATLHSKGMLLGLKSYNLLLSVASEKNDIDLSCQVFKHLVASHEHLSSSSYLNLAKTFLRTSDCTKLLGFVKEVSDLTFPRSTIILNRIILSFSESRQVDKALLIFQNMKSLNCKPDLITCNTILDMLGRAGRVDEMLHEFSAMKEANITPDIVSYNTLLNSLRKVGRFDMCEAFMKEIEASGLVPDLLTYTALIEVFGRSGNVKQSLRLFCEMKQRQIRPSLYIYRSLISDLKKMGKMELALSLSDELESVSLELARPEDFKPKKRR